MVNCRREQIHKFKTEYLLIWQKYLSTWSSIKYFGLQVQVSTKYFWISNDQVQVSTKYSIICIKYQVQVLYLTPTLLVTKVRCMELPDSDQGDLSCRRAVVLSSFIIDTLSDSCNIDVRWMPKKGIVDSSALVQAMAWCHQATSHYLSQCWPRYLSP